MAKKSNVSIVVDENEICTSNIRVTIKAYPLRKDEFKELTSPKFQYKDWILGLVSISIGYILRIIAIWIYNSKVISSPDFHEDALIQIHCIEYISIAVPIVPVIILYIVLFCKRNHSKDTALNRIQQFFEK